SVADEAAVGLVERYVGGVQTGSVEKAAVSYTIAAVDTDATAVVTFSDGNPAHNVVASGLGNGSFTVDLSGLSDGPISAAIAVTDAAGNSAPGTSDSSTLGTTAPAASHVLGGIAGDSIVNAAEAVTSVTITGMVGGDVQPGNVVTLTVNGTSYTGAVSGTSFNISVQGSDLVADPNSTVDATVATSDAAGNSTTA